MRYFFRHVFMYAVILLTGGCLTTCSERTVIDFNQPGITVDMDQQSTSIGVVRQTMEGETTLSRTEAERIISLAEEGRRLAPQLPQWAEIRKCAEKLNDSLTKLVQANKALAEIEVQLKLAAGEIARMRSAMDGSNAKVLELESIIERQKKELAEFETGMKRRQQNIWYAVTGFSAIILVTGVFLFIYADKKLGSGLVAASLILTCVSYFMAQYVAIVAMIGGGLLFMVIAMLIYHVFVNRKALFETVKTVETIKPEGWKEGKCDDLKQAVKAIQSDTTVKLVDEIRSLDGAKKP